MGTAVLVRQPRATPRSAVREHGFAAGLALAAILGAAVRLPFAFTGIGMDEGGYAYVARQWSRGARLYSGHAWVDRPQGLLVLYRLITDVGGTRLWPIRLAAVAFGVALVVVLGLLGRLLISPRAGMLAALMYAVLGVGPHFEGFTLNGELAASLPAAGAVLAAAWALRTRRRGLLLAAGILGGTAITMKQSGFDGLVAAAALVAGAGGGVRATGRRLGTLAFGAALPLAACVAQGAQDGLARWWWSVAGYRLAAPSGLGATEAQRLLRLQLALHEVRPDLGLAACAAAAGVVLGLRRSGTLAVLLAWLAAALAGFNLGGLYWPHYFVQLLPPLVLLAALAAAALPALAGAALAAVVVAPVAITLATWSRLPSALLDRTVAYDRRSDVDVRLAHVVDRDSRPGQPILALPAEADLYFVADRPAAFPYLWANGIDEIPGARARLRRLFAVAARRPLLVAVYAHGREPLDPGGGIDRVLARDYRTVARFPGISLLERRIR
jgi:hypothetical protein